MPLYEYRCPGGHHTDARRSIAERDAPCRCPRCGLDAGRALSLPQRPIMRPLGYSLRPGEPGYWQFETAKGRPAPQAIEPFSRAVTPRELPVAPDDLPVSLVADAPRSPGPPSPDRRVPLIAKE